MGEERQGQVPEDIQLAQGREGDPGDLREGDLIPEMRRHYFLEEYCIIAAERKKRPSDFRRERGRERSDPKTCPFCPGNEEMTPPAVAAYTVDGVRSRTGSRGSGTGGPGPFQTVIRR